MLGPVFTGRFITDVVGHPARPRRKNSQVGTTLTLEFQLRAFQGFTDLIVGDRNNPLGMLKKGIFGQISDLVCELLRRSGVMAVAINNHMRTP